MDGFKLTTPITIRYKDLDSLGHVNNAVYATYMEMGRAHYFHDVLGVRDAGEYDFVIAHLEVDFVAPLLLFDRVAAGTRVHEVGRTSFSFEYRIERGGALAATGRSVQVFIDPATHRKKPVPDAFLERVNRFENRSFTRNAPIRTGESPC